MRKVAFVIGMALCGAVFFAVAKRRAQEGHGDDVRLPPPQQAAALEFQFAMGANGKPTELTGIRWDIDLANYRPAGTDFGVRMCFDYVDGGNYHFAEMDLGQLILGRVEMGQERVLARATAGDGQYSPGEPVRLSRRKVMLAAESAGKLAATVLMPPPSGGRVGYCVLRGKATPEFRAVERSPILVGDDFMREGEGEGTWQAIAGGPASWRTNNLRHPLLSANAFYYLGQGKDVASVNGAEWWSQYRYRCSMRGPKGGRMGMIFGYADPKNYGLFRWTAKDLGPEGKVAAKGKRELVLVRDGQEQVLASAEGGYLPDVWYRGDIRFRYGKVALFVDEVELLAASDRRITRGAVGLYADAPRPEKEENDPKHQEYRENSLDGLMRQNAVFDDVLVEEDESVDERFDGAEGLLASGWESSGGPWRVNRDGKGGLACGGKEGAGLSRALMGDPRWNKYLVKTRATVNPGQRAGLVLLHRDEADVYAAEVVREPDKPEELVLTHWTADESQVVDSAPFAPAADGLVALKGTLDGGMLVVTAESGDAAAARVETMVKERARGRIGLQAQSSAGPVRFEDVSVEFPEDREPLVTSNAIFDDEQSMSAWTNPSSEWWPPREPYFVENEPVDLKWHRAQFPGDVELSVEPREILRDKFEVALSVSKSGRGANNGYVLRCLFSCMEGAYARGQIRSGDLMLMKGGQEVCRQEVTSGDVPEITTLSLRRAGQHLVGTVNNRPVLVYRDRQPEDGTKVAYYTRGVLVKSEATRIYSNHFHNYEFSKAPTDWRTDARSVAEVTNRWQCDSRWSFFSLRPLGYPTYPAPAPTKAAVLWSKRKYSGDVTVEFFAGIKMTSERGGKYEYARDINLNICSDGRDLNKGYSFMFGGYNNRGSYILRNGKEVASYGRGVPSGTTSYHRHWYYIRAEKRGNRVSFRVDKFFSQMQGGEIAFEDPEAMTGDRIAIWSYDCGIMISRVRISGSGGGVMEPPDWDPQGFVKSPCDPPQP